MGFAINSFPVILSESLKGGVMALIKCKECGETVSSKADTCPKCGAPFKLRVKGPSGCMMILLVLIGVIFTFYFIAKMS